MGLDIRLPIGMMFGLLGPVLIVTGLLEDTPLNIWSGGAMFLFGATMLGLGLQGQRRDASRAAASPTAPGAADKPRSIGH